MTIAVSVSTANGSAFKSNKHGKMPLVLSPLNGTLPKNAGIIDGSIAERMGINPGCQAVLNINFRGYYAEETHGQKYPNYDYTVVTILGAGFEAQVAQQVVASMDFGFTPKSAPSTTPTPTPLVATPTPELSEEQGNN